MKILNNFRPNLAPNNKVDGSEIDWVSRIKNPEEWYVSEKLEGIRAEVIIEDLNCKILTRQLKPFKSKWIKELQAKLGGQFILEDAILEGEIYCEGMNFSEIQHFMLSEDVTKPLTKGATKKLLEKFPNRSLDWLTSYDHNFQINLFDIYETGYKTWFKTRIHVLKTFYENYLVSFKEFTLITQVTIDNVKGIENLYNYVLEKGGEGLILKHKEQLYKTNRNTIKENVYFKMKDEAIRFTGIIIDVLEGTIVDPMLEPEINELGYSKTSKLQEDRMPSGKAKGFLVRMEDGRTLTVTLVGFDDNEKEDMLYDEDAYINQTIIFIGGKPVTDKALPRHARCVKKMNEHLDY